MSETMGTTGTPGGDGASRIDEEDKPNGSAQGVRTPSLGGEADDPAMPFDDRNQLDPDKKLHLPRNSESQRG
ncbi:hypothetical protein Dvina_26590 [Dactylosporangium vinaceum]|uniref:Uncharacterized protein n=1 Tax=Dactylosporangium vinaceum TaxID=53362 RepID=A0ABV5M5S6_9ACTN|nr:hypothetical protein [Dactylosporangium vinaceum]UAC01289.1 hypothetical protein Dvina_26590 [Dactylosporangium vinaceum]